MFVGVIVSGKESAMFKPLHIFLYLLVAVYVIAGIVVLRLALRPSCRICLNRHDAQTHSGMPLDSPDGLSALEFQMLDLALAAGDHKRAICLLTRLSFAATPTPPRLPTIFLCN